MKLIIEYWKRLYFELGQSFNHTTLVSLGESFRTISDLPVFQNISDMAIHCLKIPSSRKQQHPLLEKLIHNQYHCHNISLSENRHRSLQKSHFSVSLPFHPSHLHSPPHCFHFDRNNRQVWLLCFLHPLDLSTLSFPPQSPNQDPDSQDFPISIPPPCSNMRMTRNQYASAESIIRLS